MTEGLIGVQKARKLITFLHELDITDEEIGEALSAYSKTSSTYGLLWGGLGPRSRIEDQNGLDIFDVYCKALQFVRQLRKEEHYAKTVVITLRANAEEILREVPKQDKE